MVVGGGMVYQGQEQEGTINMKKRKTTEKN
jgi:hypothetical protein